MTEVYIFGFNFKSRRLVTNHASNYLVHIQIQDRTRTYASGYHRMYMVLQKHAKYARITNLGHCHLPEPLKL